MIAPTFTPATAATYRPYWRLAVARLGDRRLIDITIADLSAVVADAVARAKKRRPNSPGRASQESCVTALRALFRRAADAGLITVNPAAALPRPRRARSRRRALDDTELAELIDAVRTTSNDPHLNLLVIRFHLESGARREGALNLHCRDLDHRRATIWLREKGDSEREQPVTPTLVELLERHARSRSATHPDDPVFRTRDGQPMTRRRYSTIFDRARTCLDWADRTPVSAHVLRHTAITAVGRLAGYPVAQAFAGHTPHRSPAATSTPPSPKSPPPSSPSPASPTPSAMTSAAETAVRPAGVDDPNSTTGSLHPRMAPPRTERAVADGCPLSAQYSEAYITPVRCD